MEVVVVEEEEVVVVAGMNVKAVAETVGKAVAVVIAVGQG